MKFNRITNEWDTCDKKKTHTLKTRTLFLSSNVVLLFRWQQKTLLFRSVYNNNVSHLSSTDVKHTESLHDIFVIISVSYFNARNTFFSKDSNHEQRNQLEISSVQSYFVRTLFIYSLVDEIDPKHFMYITSCHYFYLLLIIFFSPLSLLIDIIVCEKVTRRTKKKKERSFWS